ncbi:MAG: hypothetical protein HMLKMBBP_03316 [Planctomycetes bacterium]|nr:hypothetical protein [Planctomycetota bacterium]
MTPNRSRSRIVRAACAALLAAVGATAVPGPSFAAEVKDAAKLKEALKKLYADTDAIDDPGQVTTITNEIGAILAKDPKGTALRDPKFWSDTIKEVRFSGKLYKSKSTKIVTKGEFAAWTAEGKEIKVPYAMHAGAAYTAKVAAPVLLCVIEKGVAPEEHIKSWIANEEIQKNWVVAAVAQSDTLDMSKNPVVLAYLFDTVRRSYNTDPNRVYLEGVGAATKDAQVAADQILPDRIAGLVLRNPSDFTGGPNATTFSTAVVHGPEGAEKAQAVLAKYRELNAERNVAVAAPDLASVNGTCPPLVDWLKAHKGRSLPAQYSWATTLTENTGAVFTGNLYIHTPVARNKPTTIKVDVRRESNTISIECDNLEDFELALNDDVVNLDNEVAIFVNGTEMLKKKLNREHATIVRFTNELGDYGRVYTAAWRGVVPRKAPEPPKDGDKPGDAPK